MLKKLKWWFIKRKHNITEIDDTNMKPLIVKFEPEWWKVKYIKVREHFNS